MKFKVWVTFLKSFLPLRNYGMDFRFSRNNGKSSAGAFAFEMTFYSKKLWTVNGVLAIWIIMPIFHEGYQFYFNYFYSFTDFFFTKIFVFTRLYKVHGLSGHCSCTLSSWSIGMSTESMDNVHWIHVQCPHSPLTFPYTLFSKEL